MREQLSVCVRVVVSGQEDLGEPALIVFGGDAGGGEIAVRDVQLGGVGCFGERGLVELLERRADVLAVVDEVEDERVVLVRMDAVQPRQCLHGANAAQLLVDVHRVQKRLVEAGLVFLGDDENPELVGSKALG